MSTSHDWLQEEIKRYRAENAASAARSQRAAQLLSVQELLAAVAASRRRRSLGCVLRAAFARLHRRSRQPSTQPPTILDGMVIPTPTEADPNGQTIIVIGFHPPKGEIPHG
jgi:hypothetical protein